MPRATTQRINWLPIWLLGPVAVLLAVILIWPIVQGVALSFFNTRILNYSAGKFIGLANFNALFQDEYFWNSLKVTAIYGAASVTWPLGNAKRGAPAVIDADALIAAQSCPLLVRSRTESSAARPR